MIVKSIFFTLRTHPFFGSRGLSVERLCGYSVFRLLISLNKPLIVPNLKKCGGSLSSYYYNSSKENLIINECIILYGWHQKSPNEQVLNYALLLAKYHIFCTSVRNNKLDFDSFLSHLRTKLNILREVSLENKSFNNFQSTWAHLL